MFKKLLALLFVVTLVAACSSKKENYETTETETVEQVQINVSDKVFFAFDKYDLSSEAKQTLDMQAEWLKADSTIAVVVEGNCDERGTREYNLALGQRRADAAKKYLVSKGVKSNRITTVSNGKEKPVARGTGESVWAQNRNAVTVVVVK